MTNRTSGSRSHELAARPAARAAGPGGRRRGPAAPTARDPAPDVVAQQPVGVGLVVDLVADPDEPVAARAGAERGDRVADGGVGEVHPADDAAR